MDRPKCTLTNEELVAKAREWVTSLCQTGGGSWSLRVPVDLDRDPDMIFEELCIRLLGCPCHEPQGLVFRSAEEVFKHYGVTLADDGHEPFEPQPAPTSTGGKTGDEEICWHTPIRQNPFTGGLDMKSECGHTITADEEDKRFVPPTTCLRCGKSRRFKL